MRLKHGIRFRLLAAGLHMSGQHKLCSVVLNSCEFQRYSPCTTCCFPCSSCQHARQDRGPRHGIGSMITLWPHAFAGKSWKLYNTSTMDFHLFYCTRNTQALQASSPPSY